MAPGLSAIVWEGLALLIVGSVLFYLELVSIVYFTKGVSCGPPFDWRNPACAAGNLLIWGGVRLVSAIVRGAKPVLDTFSEASAELSEMVLGRRSARIEAAVRSRLRH
jgi:hypothetical protein